MKILLGHGRNQEPVYGVLDANKRVVRTEGGESVLADSLLAAMMREVARERLVQWAKGGKEVAREALQVLEEDKSPELEEALADSWMRLHSHCPNDCRSIVWLAQRLDLMALNRLRYCMGLIDVPCMEMGFVFPPGIVLSSRILFN